MQVLIDSFKMVVDNVKFAIEYLISLINGFIDLLGYFKIINKMNNELMLSFPDWVQPFILLTLTITVLFVIVGRNLGGKGN